MQVPYLPNLVQTAKERASGTLDVRPCVNDEMTHWWWRVLSSLHCRAPFSAGLLQHLLGLLIGCCCRRHRISNSLLAFHVSIISLLLALVGCNPFLQDKRQGCQCCCHGLRCSIRLFTLFLPLWVLLHRRAVRVAVVYNEGCN